MQWRAQWKAPDWSVLSEDEGDIVVEQAGVRREQVTLEAGPREDLEID